MHLRDNGVPTTGYGAALKICGRAVFRPALFLIVAALTVLSVGATAQAAELHTFSASFGTGELSLAEHSGVAVDDATGDVYVADTGGGHVTEYTAAGTLVKTFGTLTSPTFIAVDNSSGPSEGDVYVATSDSKVHKFDAEGNAITGWASGGVLTPPGAPIAGLAVDSGGTLYVALAGPAGTVAKYDQTGAVLPEVHIHEEGGDPVEIGGDPLNEGKPEELLGMTVSSAGSLYIGRAGGAVIEASPVGVTSNKAVESPTPAGLATNGSDLYISNRQSVIRRDESRAVVETFATEYSPASPRQNAGVAVTPSGVVLVADSAHGVIDVYEEAELPTGTTGKPTEVLAQTATFNGTVSADGGPGATCSFRYLSQAAFENEFNGPYISVPCEPAGPFTGSTDVAVTGRVSGLTPETRYVVQLLPSNANGPNQYLQPESFETGPAVAVVAGAASNLTRTGATLNGTVDPEGNPTQECFFEYLSEAAVSANVENNLAPFTSATEVACAETPAEIGEGNTPIGVHKVIGGLTEDTAYVYRVGATTTLGAAISRGTVGFETFGPPTLPEVSVGRVTETTATIEAEVDPHGEPTTFQLEYFPAGAAGEVVVLPAQDLGSGAGVVGVTQELTGLTRETSYEFRVTVENPASVGPLHAKGGFTTFAILDPLLPDGRAYELVSPAQKSGEVIPPFPAELTGVSLSGSCIRPVSGLGCVAGGRKEVAPMQVTPDGGSIAYFGQAFSAGLASGGNAYVGSRGPSGWTTAAISPAALGEGGDHSGYLAYSTDLSRAIIAQGANRLSTASPEKDGKIYRDLYLRTASGLEPLVKEAPEHRQPHPVGARQDPDEFVPVYAGANSGGSGSGAFTHVIFKANDALKVEGVAPRVPEIEAGSKCEKGQNCDLYEWSGGELHLVNILPNGKAATFADFGSVNEMVKGAGGATYDGAISADGSRVFWSEEDGRVYVRIDGETTVKVKDEGEYVEASADGTEVLLSDGCIYDLETGKCIAQINDEKGGFEGILGTSEDLSHVYFVDAADLGGETALHETPVAGGHNLYAWVEGQRSFIGTLNGADDTQSGGSVGDWRPSSGLRTAQVTPDGRFLAFMSEQRLTGYDNAVLGGGDCLHAITSDCFEVFEYDAATETLTCPSCNPSGSRPLGGANLNVTTSTIQDGENGSTGNATGYYKAGLPQPENLTDDGRLFFESRDALTPSDRDGSAQDVYESTPFDKRGCAKPSGCLGLISSGEGTPEEEAYFVTATPSASDVFFATRRRLVSGDTDTLTDLYDAREGGGFDETPAAICDGASIACKGAGAGPTAQPGPASTARTSGNPKPTQCKKGRVRRHGACVKKANHKKKKPNHKKHSKSKKHKKQRAPKKKRTDKSKKGGSR